MDILRTDESVLDLVFFCVILIAKRIFSHVIPLELGIEANLNTASLLARNPDSPC